MIDPRETVLIGDKEQARADVLRDILRDEFNREAVIEGNFNSLTAKMHEARQSSSSWRMVLLAYDLPLSANGVDVIRPYDFSFLEGMNMGIMLGCIFSAEEPPDLEHVNNLFFLPIPLWTSTREEHNLIVSTLALAGRLKRARRAPAVRLSPDPILREQIRSLNEKRDLDLGRKDLRYLIRNFNLPIGDTIAVAKLTQGKSGARVFRIRHGLNTHQRGDLVIKLSPRNDLWKLRLEITRHGKAGESLGVQGYQIHVAELKKIDPSGKAGATSDNYIAEYGSWSAVCYDFLGGAKFGPFLDLETALIATPERLQAKTKGAAGFEVNAADARQIANVRELVLKTMLDWLCRTWYENGKYAKRETRRLWQAEDRPAQDFPPMPPYQLASKTKGYILSFLDSQDAEIGGRFFDDWTGQLRQVRRFVDWREGKRGASDFFSRHLPVVLSPAHGDLNASNIMLSLKEARPFLIDFPCYQTLGHALQDIASLEVAIKFVLMDRQGDSPKENLRALDHTHSQMDIWVEMEEYLVSDIRNCPEDGWRQRHCFTNNVALCFGLVGLLREYAERVQAQACGEERIPPFLDEYLPALLYHTLRAISYTSLPLFKRLLAIHSASAILTQLGFDAAD